MQFLLCSLTTSWYFELNYSPSLEPTTVDFITRFRTNYIWARNRSALCSDYIWRTYQKYHGWPQVWTSAKLKPDSINKVFCIFFMLALHFIYKTLSPMASVDNSQYNTAILINLTTILTDRFILSISLFFTIDIEENNLWILLPESTNYSLWFQLLLVYCYWQKTHYKQGVNVLDEMLNQNM